MDAASDRLEPDAFEFAQAASYTNLVAALLRHKLLVVLGLAVGLALGGYYFTQQPPVYQSSAQLMVVKKQNNPLPTADDSRSFWYDDFLSTHRILIKSPLIVRRATIERDKQTGKFTGVVRKPFKEMKSFGGGNPTGAVMGGLAIEREGGKDAGPYSGTNILNLSFTGGRPEECPQVLDEIIKAYREYLAEIYKTGSKEAHDNIMSMAEKLRDDLKGKEKAYDDFREKNPTVVFQGHSGEGRSPQEAWLSRLMDKQLSLLGQRAELKVQLARIEAAKKDGKGKQELFRQFTARPTSENRGDLRLSERLIELELQYKLKKVKLAEHDPKLEEAKQTFEITRDHYGMLSTDKSRPKGITDPVEIHILGLNQDLGYVESGIVTCQQLLDDNQESARKQAKILSEDKHYRDDIAYTREQMLKPLMHRLDEIRLTQEMGGFSVQEISPPTHGYQVAPNLTRILIAAGFLGLLGGFGLAYLVEMMDKSFRTPEEIRRRLGVPVIGHIPLIAADEAAVRAAAEGNDLDPRLCTVYEPKSFQAEAFRGLRTALYFSTQGEVHKVIQVTSPQASDGKSTLIANLAVSIAQSGRKVVLIDADLRKPRLHKIFGVGNTTGLASAIAREAELDAVIQPTPVAGLAMIPCGPRPSNPAELLTSDTFGQLLDALRKKFEYVLIDTPPLLAVSDPSNVAPKVDGVVLAIRVSKNGRPNAERAKEILKTLSANILGVVVNGAGPGAGGKYGYNNYRHNQGYAYNYNYNYTYSYQGYSGYYEDDEANGDAAAHDAPPARSGSARSGDNGRHAGHGRHSHKRGLLSRLFGRK